MSPIEALNQWKIFVAEIKGQMNTIVQILTNFGQIQEEDSKIIQAILSTNLETISSPDVIGKYDKPELFEP